MGRGVLQVLSTLRSPCVPWASPLIGDTSHTFILSRGISRTEFGLCSAYVRLKRCNNGPECRGPENPEKDEREANAVSRHTEVVCHSHLLGAGPPLFPHKDNITNFISASG